MEGFLMYKDHHDNHNWKKYEFSHGECAIDVVQTLCPGRVVYSEANNTISPTAPLHSSTWYLAKDQDLTNVHWITTSVIHVQRARANMVPPSRTWVQCACRRGDEVVLGYLLDKVQLVAHQDDALTAYIHDQIHIVKFLLKRGVEVHEDLKRCFLLHDETELLSCCKS